MSHLENGLKVTVLTQSAKFFLPDTLKVTGSTISTPKSYDEHPRQVKYGSPPRAFRFLTLQCLDFILKIQQPTHNIYWKSVKCYKMLFFVLQDFMQSRDCKTIAKKGFKFSVSPTLNFCCIKSRKSYKCFNIKKLTS